jgi:hypothetical protein
MSGDRSWTHAGVGDEAYDALARGLTHSELWSLLMGVMEQRATSRSFSDLMSQWERDRFTTPAYIDQRTLNELDSHLLAAASAFEAIELSPLAPLGVCSVVGLASQNKIVSALRGTEVVSDPTNVFALECSRRLKKDPTQVVRLATAHRCVRAQEVPKLPGFAQHFRIFCLATAAREAPNQATTVDGLVEHIRTYLAALDRLEQHGYSFAGRRLRVLATKERAALGDRIAAAITAIPVERTLLDHPYYGGLRFMIFVRPPNGDEAPLIDGGAFDWVAKLASNGRFVFLASGMGSQLVAFLFRKEQPR